MKKIIALSSVTLWLLLVLSIKADTPADNDVEFQQHSQHDLSPKIEAVINKAVELELFSGCVLIAKGDEVLFAKAYGEANKDFHIQNTMDTKFNIASGTKPFTSLAIMLLVQRGLLGLHDPVKKYIPGFPFADKITVYHCLTHTSGLGHYTKEYLEKMHRVRGFDAFLKDFIYKEKPLFEPGARFSYSNSGVVVLGAIIEKVSGMTYADFLQKNIFEPLNMKDTCSKMPEEIITNRASGYIRKLSGGYLETSLTVCPPTSATGLRTTAPDLLKFIHGVHQNRLLNQELTKVMFTPFLSDDLGPYALLWDVIPDGIKHKTGNTVIGHRGGQDGFTSWYTLHRPSDFTIVILSNLDMGAQIIPLYSRLEAILFGKEYTPLKIPADRFLFSLLKKEPLDQDPGRLQELLKKQKINIETAQGLNNMGYRLIQEGDLSMAIRILRLNTRLFPDDANAYDSLGEACMIAGQTDLAIENYQKSLVLDPKNQNAVEQLEVLKGER